MCPLFDTVFEKVIKFYITKNVASVLNSLTRFARKTKKKIFFIHKRRAMEKATQQLEQIKSYVKARVSQSIQNGKDRLSASGHGYWSHAWLSFQTACVLAATSAEVLLHGLVPQLATDESALYHVENVAVPMLEELGVAAEDEEEATEEEAEVSASGDGEASFEKEEEDDDEQQ
jgi:hypothetical protein